MSDGHAQYKSMQIVLIKVSNVFARYF